MGDPGNARYLCAFNRSYGKEATNVIVCRLSQNNAYVADFVLLAIKLECMHAGLVGAAGAGGAAAARAVPPISSAQRVRR